MSDIEAPARPFAVGDLVEVRRNLDHPAWKIQLPDDKYGEPRWAPKPGLEEVIGQAEVSKTGFAHGRFCAWLDATHFWYRQSDGMQEGSEATYITRVDEGV